MPARTPPMLIQPTRSDTRCAALSASSPQPSHTPTADLIATATRPALQRFGPQGCTEPPLRTVAATISSSEPSSRDRSGSAGHSSLARDDSAPAAAPAERPPDTIAHRPSQDAAWARGSQRGARRQRRAQAAELLGCAGAQALPRQRHRGGLAQRPRIQRGRGRARRQLPPQRRRFVATAIRGAPGEQHRHRKPLDPLRQVGQEPQSLPVGPLAIPRAGAMARQNLGGNPRGSSLVAATAPQ